MQSDKWRFEEPTPPWRPTGDPVADTQQQQAALAATRSFHPLRQLYRDCLTNTFSVQSLVLALAILVAMYWATRLFLRLFFWLSDRYDAWRHGNAVVLAPFESEEYWEREYARHPERFEWYAEFKDVRHMLTPRVSRDEAVLHLGCGTSELGHALHRATGASVLNADVSSQALALARASAARQGIEDRVAFAQVDARALPAAWNGRFKMVIDKGTLDALSCSRSDGEQNVERMLRGVARVLERRGVFVLVTTVQEESVRRWLAAADLVVEDLAKLVTTQSQRRVPVLPNDVWVVHKRRKRAPPGKAPSLRRRGAPGSTAYAPLASSDVDDASSNEDEPSGSDSDDE